MDIALGKVQTITSLLGKRNRPSDDLGGSSSSPAAAAPLSTSAVTAAPSVRPFATSDELTEAVHSLFGYPPDHPPDVEVPEEYVKECKATLGSNLDFVRRALCTNEDYFFGPQKELILLMVICSLGEEWKDPSKIPVAEIIEEWRSHSSRGRYKDDIWRPEILHCLVGSGSGASTGSCVPSVGSSEDDRESTGKRRWMHLRQVACSVCLAAWPIKMLCARAHFPRLVGHAER